MTGPSSLEAASVSTQEIQIANWVVYVTDRQQQIVELVNLVGLCGMLSLFGTVANIINLFVFYHQGLNTTVNISFFALAVSDLSCLVLQQCHIVVTLCRFSDLHIVYPDFQHATGSWPHETFLRVTCSITAYITIERCLCIVFPLTIKRVLTLKRATAIIIGIYIITLASWIPLYTTSYIDWKFFPSRNQTLLGLIFIDYEHIFTAINFTNAFFGVLSISVVEFVTMILIWQLREKSLWRKSANVQQKQSKSMSNRDKKAAVMVILIAIILIACYTPSVILCLVAFYYPEFGNGEKYLNIYQVSWSGAHVLENINSSVNIFLYLKMSTRYRTTFHSIFEKWRPKQQGKFAKLLPHAMTKAPRHRCNACNNNL